MKNFTFHIDCYCYDEYYDNAPGKALIKIDKKLFNRICQFQLAVKKLKAYTITEFDYTPEFLIEDYGAEEQTFNKWDGYIDYCILHVDDSDFWWEMCIKHTNVTVSVQRYSISFLKECFKIITCKKESLPLFINSLKSDEAKEILDKRLKGEEE